MGDPEISLNNCNWIKSRADKMFLLTTADVDNINPIIDNDFILPEIQNYIFLLFFVSKR